MKTATPKRVENFKKWVHQNGGEVMPATNEYEVVRFIGNGFTSIIYRNERNSDLTFTGWAREAWDAFNNGRAIQLVKRGPRKAGSKGTKIEALLLRDGDACFYACGRRFAANCGPTIEHLVCTGHGGPNHMTNLFLACGPCNNKAANMSAVEKLRMRDANIHAGVRRAWVTLNQIVDTALLSDCRKWVIEARDILGRLVMKADAPPEPKPDVTPPPGELRFLEPLPKAEKYTFFVFGKKFHNFIRPR